MHKLLEGFKIMPFNVCKSTPGRELICKLIIFVSFQNCDKSHMKYTKIF